MLSLHSVELRTKEASAFDYIILKVAQGYFRSFLQASAAWDIVSSPHHFCIDSNSCDQGKRSCSLLLLLLLACWLLVLLLRSFLNLGTQPRPQNAMILTLGTPKMVPLILSWKKGSLMHTIGPFFGPLQNGQLILGNGQCV